MLVFEGLTAPVELISTPVNFLGPFRILPGKPANSKTETKVSADKESFVFSPCPLTEAGEARASRRGTQTVQETEAIALLWLTEAPASFIPGTGAVGVAGAPAEAGLRPKHTAKTFWVVLIDAR